MPVSSNSAALLFELFIGVVIDIALLLWALGQHRTITRLRNEGVVIEGTIIEREKDSIARPIIFRAYYQFYIESNDSNSGKWVSSQMITPEHHRRLRVGDQVSISYLPTNPVVSRLAGKDTDHSSRDTALAGIFIIFAVVGLLPTLSNPHVASLSALLLPLLYGGVILVLLIQALRQQRIIMQLRREGVVAEGKIIDLESEAGGRTLTFHADYQFYIASSDSDTAKWTGSQMIGPAHYNRLKIGDQVSISYLPTNPVVSRLAGKDTDHSNRDIPLATIFFILLIGSMFLSNVLGQR